MLWFWSAEVRRASPAGEVPGGADSRVGRSRGGGAWPVVGPGQDLQGSGCRRRARGRGAADAGAAALEGPGEDSRGTGKVAQYPTFARGKGIDCWVSLRSTQRVARGSRGQRILVRSLGRGHAGVTGEE